MSDHRIGLTSSRYSVIKHKTWDARKHRRKEQVDIKKSQITRQENIVIFDCYQTFFQFN
jgi:hypothetical protein